MIDCDLCRLVRIIITTVTRIIARERDGNWKKKSSRERETPPSSLIRDDSWPLIGRVGSDREGGWRGGRSGGTLSLSIKNMTATLFRIERIAFLTLELKETKHTTVTDKREREGDGPPLCREGENYAVIKLIPFFRKKKTKKSRLLVLGLHQQLQTEDEGYPSAAPLSRCCCCCCRVLLSSLSLFLPTTTTPWYLLLSDFRRLDIFSGFFFFGAIHMYVYTHI